MSDLVAMETGFATGRLLIKDIGHLVGFGTEPSGRLEGGEMRRIPVMEDAWLAIEDGRILDGGRMADFPGITDWNGLEVIEADGRVVLPAWVDSHTHLVHAASREGEFVDRIRGLSYQEIAERGGGILNSAKTLRSMSEDDLYAVSLERMERLMRMGTGAIEIKSGYGLDMESELKMLRVARRLGALDRIPVKTTFLGCHAVPEGWADAMAYTRHMVDEVLPAVPELIDDATHLDAAVDELGAGPRAFDVEWSDRAGAALLQLATKEGAVILDVPRLCASREGCAALRRAFRGAPLLGFGCSQDLARLRATPAAAPWVDADQEVYDLQTALTQKRGGPGLAAAAKAYLGKALDKSQQCSDWDARPLSEAQRAYAALDAVAVLLIHEKLRSVDDAIEKLRRIPPR